MKKGIEIEVYKILFIDIVLVFINVINVIKFFLFQEQDKKKKNKKKIVIKAERDNDFGDFVVVFIGGYDDFFDDDFI